MRALQVGLAAPWLFLAWACFSPAFAELDRGACSDTFDNDGDALIDCEDGDCTNSGVCERHEATCSDALDNDGDGIIDCADPSCIGLASCLATEAPCLPLGQTGCAHGMACYVRSDGMTECRAPGAGTVRMPCTADRDAWSAERAHDCAPGLGCQASEGARLGLCSPYCDADVTCAEGSGQCLGVGPGAFGVCSVACLVNVLGATEVPCPDGFDCVTGQNLGSSGAAGGYHLRCTHAESFVPGEITDAETVCKDPGPDGEVPAASERCADTLVCYGSIERSYCRELCSLGPPGAAACPFECTALSPATSDEEVESSTGVCSPPP